jgi:3-oxoadipate enol-lactonase
METLRGEMAWLEAGAGWPLVLIHAFPLCADMWRPQLDAVPDGWRFIAPDLRGFGRGPRVNATTTMDGYALDVSALLDSLGIDRAAIGGLSMGGYVTFAIFRKEPARFSGMVLADTRPQADTPQGRDGRLQTRALLNEQGPAGVAAQMLPKLLSVNAADTAVRDVRRMIESADPAGIDAAIGALMHRPDSTPDLARIACPTLVVVGEADAITPVTDAEAMQRAIPRSTLTVIRDAGHLSSIEQPGAFSLALGDYLRSAL